MMKKHLFIIYLMLIVIGLSGCNIFNDANRDENIDATYTLSFSAQLNGQETNRGGQVYINGNKRFIEFNSYSQGFTGVFSLLYKHGESITLVAEPALQCNFVGWYIVSNGVLSQLLSQDLEYSFEVQENITIHASYTTTNSNIINNQYVLSADVYTDGYYSAIGGNLLTPGFSPFPGQEVRTLSDSAPYGGWGELSIDLKNGYQFLGWYEKFDDEEPISTELIFSEKLYKPNHHLYAKIVSV